MNKVLMPFINNNETEAKLVEWTVDEGAFVKKGDIIANLETTKADVDLESEFDGNIKYIGLPGSEYKFGETIALTYSDRSQLDSYNSKIENIVSEKEFKITKPARLFMEKNKISEEDVSSLGLEIIKTKDIEHLVNNTTDSSEISIDPIQVTIGRTVSNSKFSIPDAFQLKKINISNALIKLREYSDDNKVVLGITELIIFSISKLNIKFPFFFGKILENDKIKINENTNIGITIDIGKGLYIPVISNANKLSLKDVNLELASLKIKAMRNSFNNKDFENANFTISLNLDKDTVFVRPIIFPGQTCMISLNAIFNELVMKDGKVIENKFLNLGLAYDHRVINGYEANLFLTQIKNFVEKDLKL